MSGGAARRHLSGVGHHASILRQCAVVAGQSVAVAAAGQPPAEVGGRCRSRSVRPRRSDQVRVEVGRRARGTASARLRAWPSRRAGSTANSGGQSRVRCSRRRGRRGGSRPRAAASPATVAGRKVRPPGVRSIVGAPGVLGDRGQPRRRSGRRRPAAGSGARLGLGAGRARRCRRRGPPARRTSAPARPRVEAAQRAGQALGVQGQVGDHVAAGPVRAAATARRTPSSAEAVDGADQAAGGLGSSSSRCVRSIGMASIQAARLSVARESVGDVGAAGCVGR